MRDVELCQRSTAAALPRFVAVIFANGRDDDTPGLRAAVDNEPVQFEARIYEPGEDIAIIGKTLLLSGRVVGRRMGGRRVEISYCLLLRRPT